jgi:RimJ/RimL family protein N-acetyltransferase
MNDDPVSVELLDGRLVRIRPISPADAAALVRFHEGLTTESTRLRFFAVHPELSPGEVEHFTHVDHRDREALVALDGPDIIAVGRFDRSPGTDHAEVAFVVADEWQGRGVGTCLLRQLTVRARAAGIAGFVADTLEENYRMRDLIRHSGLMGTSTAECGVVRVAMDFDR